uniref:Phospholipase A2-like central domain-containing protein n=1 Tax=Callorhinchus milii TaxID=7868 RepID=A0A4W3GMA3_CALMI
MYPLLFHLFLLYQVMPLLICVDPQEKSGSLYSRNISRRSVLDIAFVLWCYKNHYSFSIYQVNGYGCYCGRGGDGIPLDEFDRCCFTHDCCYDRALHTSCWKGTSIYLKPNYSQCKLGRAECPEWSDPSQ